MRAAVVTVPGSVEVTTVPDPSPGPGEVVVAVMGSGICGTDLHILEGQFAPRYPIIPGHEFSGEVVALGEGTQGIRVGDRVAVDPSLPCHACHYCRQGRGNLCENWAAIGVTAPGGAAEYAVAPHGNCVRIPEGVRVEDFALVEPIACAISGFDTLPRRPAEHYLLYGAGTMGVLMARMARGAGAASVTVVERRPDRRELAVSLGGVDAALASADEVERERGWDVVIDCTGVVAAIEDGLGRVARGGTFLQFGVPDAAAAATIAPYRIYNHEITITGSMSVRNTFERAAELLASGFVDPARLITERLPLSEYAAGLQRVRDGVGLKTQVLPQLDALDREDRR